MHIVAPILKWTYFGVCLGLTLFGLYRLAILAAWWRAARRPKLPPPADPAVWPRVTVQLPLFNERWVARRLLEAVAALDYPPDRLQIQVLDDSTDRTTVLTRRGAAVLRRRGVDIEVVRRTGRAGYKAGALAHGLHTATGELIAIFDADFVPRRDFLRQVVPSLLLPGVGVVQARWGHLNRNATWFTRLQSILLDGHFAIEQPARDGNGLLLTFNGTAGVWRRAAIDAAGGWTSDTLTEDLDLSIRAQLAGWRIVYRADVVVPAELPADSNSLRAQQRRWTKGGVQVARKMLPRIVRSPLPWRVRLAAVFHLGSYAGYPLLIGLALLRTPACLATHERGWLGLLPGELPLFALGTAPLAVFYFFAQRAAGVRSARKFVWRDSFAAMALGAGLALGNALAVMEGLFGRGVVFERTPKRGSGRAFAPTLNRPRWMATYRSQGTRTALLELTFLLYLVLCKCVAATPRRWGELPFLFFFAFGLLAMSVPSLRQAWGESRRPLTPRAGPRL